MPNSNSKHYDAIVALENHNCLTFHNHLNDLGDLYKEYERVILIPERLYNYVTGLLPAAQRNHQLLKAIEELRIKTLEFTEPTTELIYIERHPYVRWRQTYRVDTSG
jgi:hypothetical protein